jgi:hypothetical protein
MKSRRNRISRRSFLRGAGQCALALPFLSSMVTSARAQTTGTRPTRFIIFYTPNGKVMDRWGAVGSEHNFQLKESMQPLNRHLGDLLVFDGIDMASCQRGPGAGHPLGMAHLLTGTAAQAASDGASFSNGNHEPIGYAGGLSIDQHIANQVGGDTPFKSLEFGVINTVSQVATRINYTGPGAPLPPESNPQQMFNRLFGSAHLNGTNLSAMQRRRRSIIDHAMGDYQRLMPKLSSGDRIKLEAHLEHLRGIESALDASGVCQGPVIGHPVNLNSSASIPAVGRAQMDMLVASLRCDLTRVATLQWICPAKEMIFSFLGHTEAQHPLSHRPLTDTDAQDRLAEIDHFFNEQLAYLIDSLKAVPEGDGTLFDNTVILVCSEVSHGRIHSKQNMPFLLAGSAGGHFRTGRYLANLGGVPHNDLLVSLMNAMGVSGETFGDPDFCNGPLTNLT